MQGADLQQGEFETGRSIVQGKARWVGAPIRPNAQVELAPHRRRERGRWMPVPASASKGQN
jgi:hypothetical protein